MISKSYPCAKFQLLNKIISKFMTVVLILHPNKNMLFLSFFSKYLYPYLGQSKAFCPKTVPLTIFFSHSRYVPYNIL